MEPISDEIKQKVLSLRINNRMSITEIKNVVNLSKSTISILIRDYPLTKEEIIDRRRKASVNYSQRVQHKAIQRDIELGRHYVPDIPDYVDNYKKGYMAELYVQYYLLRRGLTISVPKVPEKGCDLYIHSKSGVVYRCEVKSSTSWTVAVRHNKYNPDNKGFNHIPYSKDDKIDFVICMLLSTEEVFIIPFDELEGVTKVSLGGGYGSLSQGKFYQYKDRIDLFK